MDFQASFESLEVVRSRERLHLRDGDAIERGEPFGLGQTLADEDGVEAFEVGEDDELFQRSVIADVALGIGKGITPVFSIHCFGVRTKLFSPVCILIPSNSTGLKSELLSRSQMPRNSTVLRLRSQLRITSSGCSGF